MSDLTDTRAILAEAHYNQCVFFGKTIDICLATSDTPIVGMTTLYAMVRQPNKQELAMQSAHNVQVDKVFEVARQASFTGSTLQPRTHRVKYASVFWEVVSISMDDLEVSTNGKEDAAVYTLMCRRLAGNVGMMA